jgi:hypothetical protein
MPNFHTVIPIHNVDLDTEGQWEFSGGFVLASLPAWLRKQPMLENLSSSDRQALDDATHGFVVTYEAAGLGARDPGWKGPDPKVDSRDQVCI